MTTAGGDINGTGMVNPPNNEPSGAITSDKPIKKKPYQGRLKSGVQDQRAAVKIDTNKHGIRRETNPNAVPKKTSRGRKV